MGTRLRRVLHTSLFCSFVSIQVMCHKPVTIDSNVVKFCCVFLLGDSLGNAELLGCPGLRCVTLTEGWKR